MKNKRGFTLIELLAVILVLGIIITIAVPTVSYLIKKQRKNYYVAEDQNVQVSTKDYFNTNRDLRPKGAYGRMTVQLSDLIANDYIDQVVDADDKKTCSGYGMAINTGNKNYEYYTCIQCNCSNGTCEYVTDTTKVYNTTANFCTDNYNPQAYIKAPGTLYSYNGRSIDKNKLVGKVYIRLNNQDIDWKVSVPASNTDEININQYNKYVLNYSYKDDAISYIIGDVDGNGSVTENDANRALRFSASLEIPNAAQLLRADLNNDGSVSSAEARTILRCASGNDTTSCHTTNELRATSDYIVYQYKAPNVTPVGFAWGGAIKNTLNVSLEPNGILPEGVTSPSFTVSEYQVSYALVGTNNWSAYKKVTCTISDNKCTNGTFNISTLESGNYKLKFRFIDSNQNISLESTGDYTFVITKELVCPTVVADVAAQTWTNKTVNLTITVNDTFTSWEWLTKNNDNDFISFGDSTGSGVRTLSAEGVRQGKIIVKNAYNETKECLTSKYYIDKTAPTCAFTVSPKDERGKLGNYYNGTQWYIGSVGVFVNVKVKDNHALDIAKIKDNTSGQEWTFDIEHDDTTFKLERNYSFDYGGSFNSRTWDGTVTDMAGNTGTCHQNAIGYENSTEVKYGVTEENFRASKGLTEYYLSGGSDDPYNGTNDTKIYNKATFTFKNNEYYNQFSIISCMYPNGDWYSTEMGHISGFEEWWVVKRVTTKQTGTCTAENTTYDNAKYNICKCSDGACTDTYHEDYFTTHAGNKSNTNKYWISYEKNCGYSQ